MVQEATPAPIVTGPQRCWLRASPTRERWENTPEAPTAFPALRRLILPRNGLSTCHLRLIASMHMPHLAKLDLDDNNIGAGLSTARSTAHSARCEWLASLERLTALRIVSLDKNDINDDGTLRVLCALRGLPNLFLRWSVTQPHACPAGELWAARCDSGLARGRMWWVRGTAAYAGNHRRSNCWQRCHDW